jgi:hypothetical protein
LRGNQRGQSNSGFTLSEGNMALIFIGQILVLALLDGHVGQTDVQTTLTF